MKVAYLNAIIVHLIDEVLTLFLLLPPANPWIILHTTVIFRAERNTNVPVLLGLSHGRIRAEFIGRKFSNILISLNRSTSQSDD